MINCYSNFEKLEEIRRIKVKHLPFYVDRENLLHHYNLVNKNYHLNSTFKKYPISPMLT